MKELKICRTYKDKFTVVISMEDYDAFPYDGLFPTVYQYYKVDTEEELIRELNKEEELLDECIEAIYYNGEDVTDKYLAFSTELGCNKLLDCWRDNNNEKLTELLTQSVTDMTARITEGGNEDSLLYDLAAIARRALDAAKELKDSEEN